MRGLAIVVAVLCVAPAARAQDTAAPDDELADPDAEGAADEPDSPPAETDPRPADAEVEAPPPEPDDAAWARFRVAAQRAMSVRSPEARADLEALAADASSPVGRAARELLEALDRTLDAPAEPVPPPPRAASVPEPVEPEPELHDPTGAIAELAVVEGFVGGVMGIWVCVLAQCSEPAYYAGTSLLGVGAALTLSILLPNDDFHHGQAAAVGWSSIWGAGFGGMILGIAGATSTGISGEAVGGTLLGATAAGTGIGILLAATLNPDEGRVSLTGWTGLWVGGLSVMGMAITSFEDIDTEAALGVAMASSAGGLGLGVLIGELYPMSRGRVFLMSGMGVIGAGIGMGTTVLIANDYVPEAFWTAAMLGSLTGIVLTGALTEGLDPHLRDPELDVALAPLEGGGLVTVRGAF